MRGECIVKLCVNGHFRGEDSRRRYVCRSIGALGMVQQIFYCLYMLAEQWFLN